MDVKGRRTLVGEKGGRYMDRKEERALEGETRTLVVLNSRKNPNVKTGEWGSGLSHCTMSSSSVTQINKASEEEEDEGPEPLAALAAAAAASSLYCYITQHH
ncbi:unnamed protein product [Sphagnum jensenii]|uniref:Uncharacterized protein n=1 Tax=Sphagnum jensenii TaxID=128206 RepID=A0ABP1AX40_9BRYO